MTDPREALSKIKARAEKATPGPWEDEGGGEVAQHWSRPEPWKTIVSPDVRCMSHCLGGSAEGVVEEADAEFITQARTDVPRLVEALEAVLGMVERQEGAGALVAPDLIRRAIEDALTEEEA